MSYRCKLKVLTLYFLVFAVGKEEMVNYDGAQLAEEGKVHDVLFLFD